MYGVMCHYMQDRYAEGAGVSEPSSWSSSSGKSQQARTTPSQSTLLTRRRPDGAFTMLADKQS
jgi:hypothetical protein